MEAEAGIEPAIRFRVFWNKKRTFSVGFRTLLDWINGIFYAHF